MTNEHGAAVRGEPPLAPTASPKVPHRGVPESLIRRLQEHADKVTAARLVKTRAAAVIRNRRAREKRRAEALQRQPQEPK